MLSKRALFIGTINILNCFPTSSSFLMSTQAASRATNNNAFPSRCLDVRVEVKNSGESSVNTVYDARDPDIVPEGFARTCRAMNWPIDEMWKRLSDGKKTWFEGPNGSYIYWNKGDGKWWIDGPSGAGLYIVSSRESTPPSRGWVALSGANQPVPVVEVVGNQ